jgi:hypothetical protein
MTDMVDVLPSTGIGSLMKSAVPMYGRGRKRKTHPVEEGGAGDDEFVHVTHQDVDAAVASAVAAVAAMPPPPAAVAKADQVQSVAAAAPAQPEEQAESADEIIAKMVRASHVNHQRKLSFQLPASAPDMSALQWKDHTKPSSRCARLALSARGYGDGAYTSETFCVAPVTLKWTQLRWDDVTAGPKSVATGTTGGGGDGGAAAGSGAGGGGPAEDQTVYDSLQLSFCLSFRGIQDYMGPEDGTEQESTDRMRTQFEHIRDLLVEFVHDNVMSKKPGTITGISLDFHRRLRAKATKERRLESIHDMVRHRPFTSKKGDTDFLRVRHKIWDVSRKTLGDADLSKVFGTLRRKFKVVNAAKWLTYDYLANENDDNVPTPSLDGCVATAFFRVTSTILNDNINIALDGTQIVLGSMPASQESGSVDGAAAALMMAMNRDQ